MNIIKLENISKYYISRGHKIVALENISLDLPKNKMTAIVGASGSGKSTLINILAGLTRPTNGRYFFNDIEIQSNSSNALSKFRYDNIGIVVQNFALVDNMTAYQNITLPLKKAKDNSLVIKIAKQLGIENKLTCLPCELSGGECQRVALARAIIKHPKILLADEPTGSLDKENTNNIISILKSLKENTTIVIVTHNMDVAKQCDYIVTLSQGKLLDIIDTQNNRDDVLS